MCVSYVGELRLLIHWTTRTRDRKISNQVWMGASKLCLGSFHRTFFERVQGKYLQQFQLCQKRFRLLCWNFKKISWRLSRKKYRHENILCSTNEVNKCAALSFILLYVAWKVFAEFMVWHLQTIASRVPVANQKCGTPVIPPPKVLVLSPKKLTVSFFRC